MLISYLAVMIEPPRGTRTQLPSRKVVVQGIRKSTSGFSGVDLFEQVTCCCQKRARVAPDWALTTREDLLLRTPGAGPSDNPQWRVTSTLGMMLNGFYGWPVLSSGRIGLRELSQRPGRGPTIVVGGPRGHAPFLHPKDAVGGLREYCRAVGDAAIRSEQEFR